MIGVIYKKACYIKNLLITLLTVTSIDSKMATKVYVQNTVTHVSSLTECGINADNCNLGENIIVMSYTNSTTYVYIYDQPINPMKSLTMSQGDN